MLESCVCGRTRSGRDVEKERGKKEWEMGVTASHLRPRPLWNLTLGSIYCFLCRPPESIQDRTEVVTLGGSGRSSINERSNFQEQSQSNPTQSLFCICLPLAETETPIFTLQVFNTPFLSPSSVLPLLSSYNKMFFHRCQLNGWPWSAFTTGNSPTRAMSGAMVRSTANPGCLGHRHCRL